MNTRWLVSMALALMSAGSGLTTTAAAQDVDAQNNKLVFAVMVNQIFNHGELSLIDDLMAKNVTNNGSEYGRDAFKAMIRDLRELIPDLELRVDDVTTQDDRVIGRVTQTGGGASESRIILLKIDEGLVREYWSWADNSSSPPPFGLKPRPDLQPPASGY